MDLLNDARINPMDMMSTLEMVMALRRQSRFDGVESEFPCSIRDMTGLTRIPLAQVRP